MVQHEDVGRVFVRGKILEAVRRHNCRTVKEVVSYIQGLQRTLTLNEIRSVVEGMEREGEVILSEQRFTERSFVHYLRKEAVESVSFQLVLIVTVLTLFAVYILPSYEPWNIIRLASAGPFVLFLPGYTVIELLLQKKALGRVEKIALSIGLSMAIVPAIGLVINFTPWGLALTPVVLALTLPIIAFLIMSRYAKFAYLSRVP